MEERNVEFKNSRVLFLTQPVDYVHVIDKDSPLYELSKSVLRGDEPLELIVIMAGEFIKVSLCFCILIKFEGIVEGTGMACQVRTSYICNEILWGHRFEPAISRYPKFGGYQVDYNKIDKTYEVRKQSRTHKRHLTPLFRSARKCRVSQPRSGITTTGISWTKVK